MTPLDLPANLYVDDDGTLWLEVDYGDYVLKYLAVYREVKATKGGEK